ncbi:MAG: SPASM domain-containing protein [Theionarchaea archaeon]|nr:SPASM domain-containing protein [Theionarchaea archaeon]
MVDIIFSSIFLSLLMIARIKRLWQEKRHFVILFLGVYWEVEVIVSTYRSTISSEKDVIKMHVIKMLLYLYEGRRGTYHNVFSAQVMIDKGVHGGIQMVATSENSAEDVFTLLKKSKDMGANGFFINFPYCGKWMDEDYYYSLIPGKWFYPITKALDVLREKNKEMNILYKGGLGFVFHDEHPIISSPLEAMNTGCEGGATGFEVMPNGDVYPCCLSLGSRKFLLGNINNKTLHQLWSAPVLDVFRSRKKYVPFEGRCRECMFFDTCSGGCFIGSQNALGTIQGDPACPLIRGIIDE